MNWQLSARISSKAFIMEAQFEKVDVKTLSIILCLNFWLQELPWWSMVKTLCFHCRGDRFDLWSGNCWYVCLTDQKKKKNSGYK